MFSRSDRRAPPDQAHGLRQRFAAFEPLMIALVHNPFVAFAGIALERLAGVLAGGGLHTLVADAADTAAAAHELAGIDIASCIEPLSPRVSFLAARGLPARWIDSRGSTAGFVDALRQAAPRTDAMLLHAGAGDLRRMLDARAQVPVVIAGNHPESITHAYAAIKLLAQRGGLVAYDLVLVAGRGGAGVDPDRVARHLSGCSEHFLGVALRASAVIDPALDADEPVGADLDALLALQCRGVGDAPPVWAERASPRAALC